MTSHPAVIQILRAPIGGIRKHVFDIMMNLADGAMPQILITNVNDSDRDLDFLISTPHVRVIHVDIYESPGFSDVKNLLKIYKILREIPISSIHGHGAKGGLYARLVSFFLRRKCFYTPHGGSLHRVHGGLNLLYDVIEKGLMPFTDLFIFESHYSADTFWKNIGKSRKKEFINYNGIDFDHAFSERLYEKGSKLNLASFGLLRELKGHDIVIRACAILKEKNIPFHYTVFGKGDYHSYLSSLISDLHLQNDVTLESYSQNIYEDMKKFDFIVHPSRFESFGYVPVEAHSLKIPVVSSQEGGLKEVMNSKIGFVSSGNKPEEYVSIFQSLYEGRENIKAKVEAAYEFSKKNFSKTLMLKNLKEIYSS